MVALAREGEMNSEMGIASTEPSSIMQIFLSAFDEGPDPQASNARYYLGELRVIAFVSVLCGSTSCADLAAFGRAKERLFRGLLKLKRAITSHCTFCEIFWVIDPKTLDAALWKSAR